MLAYPVMSWPCRRLLLPEIDPAARTELGLPTDHAGRDSRNIGNFVTAQPERIAHASLLLLHGIGPCCGGPRPHHDRRDHTSEPSYSNRETIHVPPKSLPRVNCE